MLTIVEKKDDALIIQVESKSKSEIKDAIQCLSCYVLDSAFNITYSNGTLKAIIYNNPNGWLTLEEIEQKVKETLNQ